MTQQFHCQVCIQKKMKTPIGKDPRTSQQRYLQSKTWEKPKCPSKYNCVCVCTSVYIYTDTHLKPVEYYSAIKKEILPFVAM